MMPFWIPVKSKKFLISNALIISWVADFLICHKTKKKHIRNLLFMTVKYGTQRENMWSFWHIKLKNENFVYVTQLFNLYECSYLLVEHKVRQRSCNRGCSFNLNDYVFPFFSKQIDSITKRKILNSERGNGTWTTRWSLSFWILIVQRAPFMQSKQYILHPYLGQPRCNSHVSKKLSPSKTFNHWGHLLSSS